MDFSSILNFLTSPLILAQAANGTEGDQESGQEPGYWAEFLADWEGTGTALLFIFSIFILPFIVSHLITRAIRMPAHSFRLGVMLAAITGGFLFAWNQDFQIRLGTDMSGGTTLIYDIVESEDGDQIDAGSLATALTDRINPSGTKEISIRPRGESQIEITVPMTDEFELRKIKDLLQNSGQLEFRIVANTRDHGQDIIPLAREQAEQGVPRRDVVDTDGNVVGRWYRVGRETQRSDGIYPLKTPVLGDVIRNSYTGEITSNPPLNRDEDYALEKWMQREEIAEVDVLMAFENAGRPYTLVTGDDLASATTEFDKLGRPVVAFRLDQQGANKMLEMTSRNQPDGEFHRRMAIIMDEEVLSAPQLNEPISNSGQISGRFTKEEVDFLVTVLRSGRLPATLSDEPASENRVGAGLGATTIQKGTNAAIWAIIVTFACILLYYRFAGVVASLALLMNGLLIFGVMIFIGQPLTLPGLAGLVLTVGMSVDANVLVFERIREEKAKGSAPRMSIRNGFDRAFTTIIDANLTTLIAAIVLYWIGTDQVRGFAVALIIGIACSVFTATFCSRILFEIAEKLKFVSLSMADAVGFLKRSFFGEGTINFMGWQKPAMVVSLLVIVVGIGAVVVRGRDILNIDFTGGTSVTFQLQQPMTAEQVRELTQQMLTEDSQGRPVQSTLVRVETPPADTVYTLVTSIDDVDLLSKQLSEGFAQSEAASLVTYRVTVLNRSLSDSSGGRSPAAQSPVRFVSYSNDAPQENETAQSASDQSDEQGTEQSESESADEGTTADPQAFETEEPQDETPDSETAQAALTEFTLKFDASGGAADMREETQEAKIDGPTLREQLVEIASSLDFPMNEARVEVEPDPMPSGWTADDVSGHSTWIVRLPVEQQAADQIVDRLRSEMQRQPLWLALSQIGTRVAGEMQQRAIAAVLISLIFIVAYIWFRFQKISYGLAAVVALVHDVMIALGVIALCHWLHEPLSFLLIEDFKIGLTEIAAFLTIIGYSLNDTIVVFDRIREVRGRSPKLNVNMINDSINQTLSRTLLTSGTTFLTILLLYVFGGEGIHTFAFALMIGVIVGTYSSVFIAAPALLALSSLEKSAPQRAALATR